MSWAHEHDWKLAEDGYTRTWSTVIRDDGTITATYQGPQDWDDDGDCKYYLRCSFCSEERPLPDNAIIDFD